LKERTKKLLLCLCVLASPARASNICQGAPPQGSAPSAGGVPTAPLIVDDSSNVVVMEYEAWFGPKAERFQPQVTTCLQSRDMQTGNILGGYDSADPAIISQHAAWLAQMGVDAVTIDLTNNVSCIFDGDAGRAFLENACQQPNWAQTKAFRASQLGIRDNDANLYPAWTALATRLKLIPLLGGFDRYALTPEPACGKPSLEKEADYFGNLMRNHPNLNVIYQGRPLMLIYLGTPVDPEREARIVRLLGVTHLNERYTFRLVGGFLDSQPSFWEHPNITPTGPIQIAPHYGFWSVVDRLNFWGAPPAPYYPTYSVVGARPEDMTASLATPGQNGWNCPTTRDAYHDCPDAALRFCRAGDHNGCNGRYDSLREFMLYATLLRPIFLIVNQFNEFSYGDEGWNANTNDDAEPTLQWGYSGIRAVIDQVRIYRGHRSQR